ncbi:MAG: response regulator [Acidobacteria bacterium]|nr:response regulator [Acidobacteriota bacterium]MBV9475575.1 response regulator [Acidobacteriota bacterium]
MSEPRVLIVESNEALRAMLFTILRHQPVGVDTAATAEDALEKVLTCDYALIVVDVDMPNEAGTRFVAQFTEQRPDAPTFILAVRDPRNDIYLDPDLVSAVLNKPLEIDTLAELVRECALVVPPPDDPLPCPPSESDIRARMDRGPYIAN